MHSAMGHFVLLIFACLISWLGLFMSRKPEKTSRIFAFGQAPTKFSLGFFRIVGRIFNIFFALASIIYLILIPLDLLGVNLGQ
jgi:cytochrome b561